MISDGLKFLFDKAVLPGMLLAAGAAFPPLRIALSIPVIGPWIEKVIQWCVDYLIDKGIVGLKVSLIDSLSEAAQKNYAPQIQILREAQAQPTLTPEQEQAYADRLDELIKSRANIVNG